MKNKISIILIGLFVLGSFGYLGLQSFIWYKKLNIQESAQATVVQPGAWPFNTTCVGCHQFNGRGKPSTPHVPVLQGQHKGYILAQINDMMNGKRKGNLVDHMQIAFPSLSDKTFEEIAGYLESLGEYKPKSPPTQDKN